MTFPARSHIYAIRDARGMALGYHPPFSVHPAQLYETLAALGIFLALWFLYPRRKFAGAIAWSFGLLYSVWRFINEFFRADSGPWRPELSSLTVFQYMSLLLFAAFAATMIVAWRRGRAPYEPPPEEEERGPRPAREEAS